MSYTANPQVIEFTKQLISKASVTPKDANCLVQIIDYLKPFGFNAQLLPSGDGEAKVDNVWLIKHANNNPQRKVFVFAGHTDVVPTGPLEQWHTPPFEPTLKGDVLYGRGAADMKSSIAAFVYAVADFVQAYPNHSHDLALLLTSDEEGPAIHGTVKVVEWLKQSEYQLDYCIVGEPTSSEVFGDTIKNGRRGSLNGKLTVYGKQGHIAYPHLAQNPIHSALKALDELVNTKWDEGNAHFPATCLQISNIHAGAGATNIIPGDLQAWFNFRFSSEQTFESLQTAVHALFDRYQSTGLTYSIDWTLSGKAFITQATTLTDALKASILEHVGVQANLSTTGGTSDGRFIADICKQVIEFGPINASIHQINEHIYAPDIMRLQTVYYGTMQRLLA